MKEDNVVTAAALIIQESKDSEKCRGAAAAGTDAHAKTMRGVQTESEANGQIALFVRSQLLVFCP